MTLSAPLSETLQEVASVLASTREPWWIIGSAVVALHGFDPAQVRDVDVLLAENDARAVLHSLGIAPRPSAAGTEFHSTTFGCWRGLPLPVEFMAGFTHRKRSLIPQTRQEIRIGTTTLYVPDRSELRAILYRFGRPKDLARIALLAD